MAKEEKQQSEPIIKTPKIVIPGAVALGAEHLTDGQQPQREINAAAAIIRQVNELKRYKRKTAGK